MRGKTDQSLWAKAVEVAGKQHGALARRQLFALGFTAKAIEWALRDGRLYPSEWRGVYVVGVPRLAKHGRLRAAQLALSDHAVLVDDTAGGLWQIWNPRDRDIHLSVPAVGQRRNRDGIRVHRRALKRSEITRHWGIPITTPLRTVIDLAAGCDRPQAERLINAADARNLIRADVLHERLAEHRGQPGVPLLNEILGADHFVLTESELERLFVPLAARAGLGKPQSQRRFGRHRVDFFFPELNLVVECDSLRYHRTVQQQQKDLLRDHVHLLDERQHVRVTHYLVVHDPEYVVALLTEVRLRSARASSRVAASGA